MRVKIIEHFMFLEREHGLRRVDQSVAHEYAMQYSSNELAVRVVLEMPDIPFIVVQKKGNRRIAAEVQFRLADQACDGAAALWTKARDGMSIERWTRSFRAGEYDHLLDRMLSCYAKVIRERWPKIVDETVFLHRKQSTVLLNTIE